MDLSKPGCNGTRENWIHLDSNRPFRYTYVWYMLPYHREDGMVKITTYIDDRLLKQALKATHARTKRAVLESGLRTLLAEVQRKTFLEEFDHLRLQLSPTELEESRR